MQVEAWLCGEGAFWVEIGRSPLPQFDAFNLKPNKCYHFRVTARNKRGWGDSIMTTHKVDLSRPTQMPAITTALLPSIKTFAGSSLRLTVEVFTRGVVKQCGDHGMLGVSILSSKTCAFGVFVFRVEST